MAITMARRRRWPYRRSGHCRRARVRRHRRHHRDGGLVPAEHGGCVEHRARRRDRVRRPFGRSLAGREPLSSCTTAYPGSPRRAKPRHPASSIPRRRSTFWCGIRIRESLARIGLPFWLLRLKSDPIRFGAYASGFDDEGVTLQAGGHREVRRRHHPRYGHVAGRRAHPVLGPMRSTSGCQVD